MDKKRKQDRTAYYVCLAVTVLVIGTFVGMAAWCCIERQFFYVPPDVLSGDLGASRSSGIWLLAAALAGLVGGRLSS